MNWNRFFDPNNMFFRELSRIVDVVGLSLLWLALCLPVVTIAPATAALYHTAVKGLRADDEAAFTRFLHSFLENLKQGVVISLIFVPIVLVFYFGVNVIFFASDSTRRTVMLAIYLVAGLLVLGLCGYVLALLGRFSFSTGALFRTAFQLALIHLPATAAVAVLNALAICAMGFLVWPVLAVPMLTALLASFPLEKVFARYIQEDSKSET